MPQQIVQREALSLTPSTCLSLFTLDASNVGLPEPFYFYDGSNNNYRPLVFNSVTYTPFPIKMEDVSINGQGQLSRPKITVANPKGFVSMLLLNNRSLVGAKVSRTRVHARFIDAVNFPRNRNPYGTPDPTAAYEPEVFYINRRISENNQYVSWELSTLMEVEGVKLPRRQFLANVCGFRYRDQSSCKYGGVPIADRQNKRFVGGEGTYGFASLTDRGEYDDEAIYNSGDYVYIYPTIPQLADVPIFYVCIKNSVTGIAQSPANDSTAWVADACARSCAACRLRFPAPDALRGGFFPGLAQAPFMSN